LLVATAGATVTACAGILLTDLGPWYVALHKPSWQPPDFLFGPVWTLIFALCAVAAARAWQAARDDNSRRRVVVLFVANAVLNALWSGLFFTLKRTDLALLEVAFLWTSIVLIIRGIAPFAPRSAWLLAPYLAWVSFAAGLNATILRLNPLS
jgi:tryptophan-rich sensory protein